MRIEFRDGLAGIDPVQWDDLVADDSPFLEWGWLASLEESGCVSPQTGWLPRHAAIWDGDRLVAACPLYLKTHSQGEFVFDHAWASAAHRVGIDYYPKLLVGVPFTPVAGRRLLTHPALPAPTRAKLELALARALVDVCRRESLSSAHVNFCRADEIDVLARAGFVHRTGYQFQWINPGWTTFEDFLGALRSKRRIQIKRERRELESQRIRITAHTGEAISDDLFATMFELYRTTVDKLEWGMRYLNRAFFDLLGRRWRRRLCFFVARRDDEVIAGTFTVRKGDALYGRYWGAFEDVRYLHFNVCYYAAIQYCLEQGIARFEPGAGGEFKHLRGFDARPTHSAHFLAHPGLARAVADYLERERAGIAGQIEWLGTQSPIKETRRR